MHLIINFVLSLKKKKSKQGSYAANSISAKEEGLNLELTGELEAALLYLMSPKFQQLELLTPQCLI